MTLGARLICQFFAIFGGKSLTQHDLLTGEWFVPFLAAGFLLTAALVGSVVTVQRFRRPATEVRGG